MTIQIFYKLWAMTYFEVIDYLLNKYGPVKYTYGSRLNRGYAKGLFVHHIEEYKITALSSTHAKKKYREYQKPAHLCFCNYLEHFLLHLIIAREFLKEKALSAGGLGNYIYPDLYQFFINKKRCRTNHIAKTYYDVIEPYTETFLLLQKEYINLKGSLECYLITETPTNSSNKSKYWTPDQDAILKKYYNSLDANGVQKLLDEDYERKYPGSLTKDGSFYRHIRSLSSIRTRAGAIGLSGVKQIPWTPEEDAILYKYYQLEGEDCFSRIQDRTYYACRVHTRHLGLITGNRRPWTKEEDDILIKLYPEGSKAVKQVLPDRTITAIFNRAKRLLVGNRDNLCTSVRCIETSEVFTSIKAASDATGIARSSISECASGIQKTAGGYHWERVY